MESIPQQSHRTRILQSIFERKHLNSSTLLYHGLRSHLQTPHLLENRPSHVFHYINYCYTENTHTIFALLPGPSSQQAHEKHPHFARWINPHSADSYLHISSFSCFYSCINQTFSTSHCVEKKFSGSQARVEAVSNKAFCCRELRRVGKNTVKTQCTFCVLQKNMVHVTEILSES